MCCTEIYFKKNIYYCTRFHVDWNHRRLQCDSRIYDILYPNASVFSWQVSLPWMSLLVLGLRWYFSLGGYSPAEYGIIDVLECWVKVKELFHLNKINKERDIDTSCWTTASSVFWLVFFQMWPHDEGVVRTITLEPAILYTFYFHLSKSLWEIRVALRG